MVFGSKINLTQVLNQPICAVKEVKVNIDYAKDIEISAVIVNSGSYIAKNASIEWEFYHVEDLKKSNHLKNRRLGSTQFKKIKYCNNAET